MESVIMPYDEEEKFSKFSRKSEVAELLELCIQPTTNNERHIILLEFWNIFMECVQKDTEFCEDDVVYMYALNYVYKYKELSFSSVSRSVYFYLKQINLPSSEADRNKYISFREQSFATALDQFTNIHSLEGKAILEEAAYECMHRLNIGLLRFLIKFGLLENTNEVNDQSRNIVEKFVFWFNSSYQDAYYEDMEASSQISMNLDEFLQQMKECNMSFRKSMLIFASICINFEYQALEKQLTKETEKYAIESLNFLKWVCIQKFVCLDIFTEATLETFITFKDIKSFLATFLNFLPREVVGTLLQIMSKTIFTEALSFYNPRLPNASHEYLNPRSLKDLIRCKIRDCLQSSTALPEQVYKLPIPVSLKKFLVFGNEEIWEDLALHQRLLYIRHKMYRLMRE